MEYYKPALSGVFIKRARAQAGKPPVHNFDIFFCQTFPPKQNAALYFVCVPNESHFVSKAPNGINEEKQY